MKSGQWHFHPMEKSSPLRLDMARSNSGIQKQARISATLEDAGGPVVFSPDGKLLASCGDGPGD